MQGSDTGSQPLRHSHPDTVSGGGTRWGSKLCPSSLVLGVHFRPSFAHFTAFSKPMTLLIVPSKCLCCRVRWSSNQEPRVIQAGPCSTCFTHTICPPDGTTGSLRPTARDLSGPGPALRLPPWSSQHPWWPGEVSMLSLFAGWENRVKEAESTSWRCVSEGSLATGTNIPRFQELNLPSQSNTGPWGGCSAPRGGSRTHSLRSWHLPLDVGITSVDEEESQARCAHSAPPASTGPQSQGPAWLGAEVRNTG